MTANPYHKTVEAPLPAPDTKGPLGLRRQLPENIMWMPDGRGFKKRPGSLPFARSRPVTNADASVTKNWLMALACVRTPSPGLAASTSSSDAYTSSSRLLGYQYCGLVLYNKLRAAGLTGTSLRRFVRSPLSRTDANYYLYTYATQAVSSALTGISSVADVPKDTSYTTFNQQNELAWMLRPESVDSPEVMSGSPAKVLSVYQQALIPGATSQGRVSITPSSGNEGRIDFVTGPGGTFIGGAAGAVQHYDGFTSYVDGAYSFADVARWFIGLSMHPTPGNLNGTYQYMYTHVVRLPTGEVIEGDPAPISSITGLVNKQVIINMGGTLFGAASLYYRSTDYTTATTGLSVTTATITNHDFQVGEYIYFFTSADAGAGNPSPVHSRRVTSVTSTTVTFDVGIELAGTTHISKGDSVRLYRTVEDGDIFYKLLEYPSLQWALSDNLTDNALDTALGAEYIDTDFTRTPSPAAVHSITEHQNRTIVYAGSSSFLGALSFPKDDHFDTNIDDPAIYFTSATSRHYYPREFSFPVPLLGNGDRPVGVASVGDTLYIFNSRSIYYVHGSLSDDPSTYTLSLLTDQFGCTQPRSIIRVGTSVFFVSQQGLVVLSGTSFDGSVGTAIRSRIQERGRVQSSYFWPSKNLLLLSNDRPTRLNSYVNTTGYSYSADDALGISGSPNRLLLRNPGQEETLVFDITAGRWSVWTFSCHNGGAEIDGDFVYVPSLNSAGGTDTLRRLCDNANWTDAGTPFTARYYSTWFDDGAPSVDKTYNRVTVFSDDVDNAGVQNFKLTVKTERDWMPGSVVDSYEVTDFGTGLGYGEQAYGTTPYGDPLRVYKMLPLTGEKVKSMRVILENNEANGDFFINALALESADSYTNARDA